MANGVDQMTVNFEDLNRPMLLEDVEWVHQQKEYNELKDLVHEYALHDLPVFNGSLRNSNLFYIDDDFNLTHWFRMWEYLSIYFNVIKQLDKGAKILDCGGVGSYFPYWLGEQGRNVKVIDIQEFHINLSNLVAQTRNIPTLEFAFQNMINIQADDNSFDCVYSISVLEHLPLNERKQAIEEMCRVLKPGGLLGLTFDFGDDFTLNEEKSHASILCITSVAEIFNLHKHLPLEIVHNDLNSKMDKYKTSRPQKEEFECRYMLRKTLSATSSWKELINYLVQYSAYHISPKIGYRLMPKSTGNYNFFRLFLRKLPFSTD